MKYLLGVFVLMVSIVALGQDGKLKRPDIPGDVMVDIGLNYWDASSDSIDQKGWTSKSISVYYVKRKALSNKLSLMYGGGLGLEKFSLGKEYTIYSTSDSAFISQLPVNRLIKNRLAATYLDATVEFRFHPSGTQDGEGFFIGIGGIAGLKMNAHTKWKFDINGETIRQKISGGFDLTAYRYGTQVRLGFKGVHFFYKQYFSSVFKNPVGVNGYDGTYFNPSFRTFGINITGF